MLGAWPGRQVGSALRHELQGKARPDAVDPGQRSTPSTPFSAARTSNAGAPDGFSRKRGLGRGVGRAARPGRTLDGAALRAVLGTPDAIVLPRVPTIDGADEVDVLGAARSFAAWWDE